MSGGNAVPRCTFCGRSAKEVRSVIAAGDGAICDDCLDLCVEATRVGLGERAAELPRVDGGWTVGVVAYYPGLPSTECRVDVEVSRPSPPERRTIMCEGVAELVLRPTTTNMPYALQIVPIDDRGWEHLRYLVSDGVEGQLRFYCAEVRVVTVTPSAPEGANQE